MIRKKIFLAVFVSLISNAVLAEKMMRPPPEPPPDSQDVEYEIVIPKLAIGLVSPVGQETIFDAMLFNNKTENRLILTLPADKKILGHLEQTNLVEKVVVGARSIYVYLNRDSENNPISAIKRAGFKVINPR